MVLHGAVWCYMVLPGATWYYMVIERFVTSRV